MKLKKALAVCVIAVLCSLPAGCGKGDNSAPEAKKADESLQTTDVSVIGSQQDSTSDESKDTPSDGDSSGPVIIDSDVMDSSTIKFELDDTRPYDTLEEYLASEPAKKMVAKISGTDSQGIITTSVFAENGSLVFERKFSKDFNLWLEEDFIENVKKTVEEKREVFVSLVDQLESCINKKTITVKVRYVDPDGNKIYERVFDNEKLISAPEKESSKEASKQTSAESSKEASKQTSAESSKEASKQESSQTSKKT